MSIVANKGSLLLLLLSFFLVPAYSQTANPDEATTDEETTVTVEVTKNDFSPFGFRRNSLDLNPDVDRTQRNVTTNEGTFSSDDDNIVTFKPAANFTGKAQISYTFRDALGLTSNSATITITVNPVNDAPVITGQNPVTVEQGRSITLTASMLKVTDPDNKFPDDFTLSVLAGPNYSVANSVVTPAASFTGPLHVSVFVNDGQASSGMFDLNIEVTASRNPPVITGQNPLKTNEDAAITLKFADILVSDSDSPYPTGFTIKIAAGDNYTANGNTVTPKADFYGTLTVPIRVNDGTSDSGPFNLTIEVAPVNDAPTLGAVTVPAMKEGAALQSIGLKGISAGPQETQALTVTVATNKPELFETLDIVYTSPQATGTLRIKPKGNGNGTAQVTVTVQDNGPASPAPNVNQVKQTVNVTIQPVNDAPVFQSQPVLTAAVGEAYVYNITVTDADGETITLTAPTKPAWLTFAVQSNGKARLSGTPPANASGTIPVTLSAKDAGSSAVLQSFTITINSQPVVKPIAIQIQEDKVYAFTPQQFAAAFTDTDGDALTEIMITTLPRHGTLRVNNASIGDAATIIVSASGIGLMTYTPDPEYSGNDTLRWNASDGKSYAKTDTYASIAISAENDPPMIIDLETDTLAYEIGNETPRHFTATFRAVDADNDSLTSAEVGFRRQNHSALNDRLIFTNTKNITGKFDNQAGILSLTGKATLAEYTEAIRSIQYSYVNMSDMTLDIKNIYITLNDGKTFGETKNRMIGLIYTFKDLDIPTGFTPNGDNANDYWKITSIKGTDQYKDAEIRVFNRRGQLLYEATGFEKPWDGTFAGERLPVDSYYYTIDLKYNKIQYKGVITILR